MANPIDLTTVAKVMDWLKSPQMDSREQQQVQLCITGLSASWLAWTGMGPLDGSYPVVSPFVQPVSYSEAYDGNGSETLFLTKQPIISIQSLTIGNNVIQASTTTNQNGYVIWRGKAIQLRGGGGSGSFTSTFYPGGCGQFFAKGVQNVAVQYLAGYAYRAIPNELQAVPGSPYLVNTQQRWISDLGVKYFSSGIALVPVSIAPAVGQYYVNAGGQYLFNSADAGQTMQISYNSNGTPADVELAANQIVSLSYKKRQWIGQTSQGMGGTAGTTTYGNWVIPVEAQRVLTNYTRLARA